MTMKYLGFGFGAIICCSSPIGIPIGLAVMKLTWDVSDIIKKNS